MFELICYNIFEQYYNLLKYFEKTYKLYFQSIEISK